MTVTRAWMAAAGLALVFLCAHLPFLATTLEDIDSVNFALGMRRFDIGEHRPHPPGYPILIALGKAAKSVVARMPSAVLREPGALDVHALAVWSALFGAAAIFPLFQFFRVIEDNLRLAVVATALTIACPLFWFTASRPMSDVPGLTAALVAQALLATAYRRQQESSGVPGGVAAAERTASNRLILAGALAAGLAIGMRLQTAALTLPLLAFVLFDRERRGMAGGRLGALVALFAGILVWIVPLLVASGGPSRYLVALTAQAGEDLADIDLLVTHPTPRRFIFSLLETFVLPWAFTALAVAVLTAALAGAAVMIWRSPSGLSVLIVSCAPYVFFHMLFQETVSTRYALPVIPVMTYLACRGIDALAGRAMPVVAAAVVGWCLAVTVPALTEYARTGSPVFRALIDVNTAAHGEEHSPVVGMHLAFKRALRDEALSVPVLQAPKKHEWLELVKYWRDGGQAPVWFLADPRRTDLALVDHGARRLVRAYRWSFPSERFMSGVRPGALDWYEIKPPRWFADEGWALTPETAGVAHEDGRGPANSPVSVHVERNTEAVVVMIGGRNLGRSGDGDVRFTLLRDGQAVDTWQAAPDPGFFLRMETWPPGTLAGESRYALLQISAEAADGSARPISAALEQFDIQSTRDVVVGFDRGWHEQEYNPATGRLWRWCSDSATARVHNGGRDLTLRLGGESPLRYFEAAPNITVRAGAEILGQFAPDGDFSFDVGVPADALDRSGGLLTVTTDRTFVPDEVTYNGDKRRLGLRVYEFSLK